MKELQRTFYINYCTKIHAKINQESRDDEEKVNKKELKSCRVD